MSPSPEAVDALRRSAYALPVTPQMLLLAAQRLHRGAGAGTQHYCAYLREHFPLVLRGRSALEADVRRKLSLCVTLGLLEEVVQCCQALWGACTAHPPPPPLFRPAPALARNARLSRLQVRRFWAQANAEFSCIQNNGQKTDSGADPHGDSTVTVEAQSPKNGTQGAESGAHSDAEGGGGCGGGGGLAWGGAWMRRALCCAHSALGRWVERLAPEEEASTQTDQRLTDWVSPTVADPDYLL